jgi:hypothetical protein
MRCAALACVAWPGCGGPPPTSDPTARAIDPHSPAIVAPAGAISLRDATADTGITFTHTDGSFGQFYMVEAAASGLATFDYDGDELPDIYFLSGTPLPGAPADSPPGGNALYRNKGGFQFEDVTRQAGVGGAGYGMGVAAGDFDNDGRQDLYVSNFGPKVLYRNNGDGTFSDVTAAAGVSDGDQVGAGVCFLDLDNDGHLDLFAANYVNIDFDQNRVDTQFGFPIYPSPLRFAPRPQTLFRNRGDGSFEDISQTSGTSAHPGRGMGTISLDVDDDGAVDIVCACDVAPNLCFRNQGGGRFEEIGLQAGIAHNADGLVRGNMGVDSADYDHDGKFDLFITTYQREFPILFHNLGGGGFEDVAQAATKSQRCYNNSKWGCGFADFDNDGHKDIFVGIGHLQVNIEQYDKTSTYAARPMLLRGDGRGAFADVTDESGDGLLVECVARGVALEDLDNDGRIDVVISNSRRAPVILRNESQNTHHWLHVRLRGVESNRDAVGARVKVVAADLVQYDAVRSGRGYQSHFGTRLHFGLGRHERIDRIEVHWPSGRNEAWSDVAADQILTLVEGSGNPPG